MTYAFINNGEFTLSSAVSSSDTLLTAVEAISLEFAYMDTANAARIKMVLTVSDTSLPDPEIVRVIEHDGYAFTVERGAEGTTAQDWPAGAKVHARITAGMLGGMAQRGDHIYCSESGSTGQAAKTFMFGDAPAIRNVSRASTGGSEAYGHNDGFGAEVVISSHGVNLGVVPDFSEFATYYRGDVVAPPTPDGFHYWLDLNDGNNSSGSNTSAPIFIGDSGATVASENDAPVGFWVPQRIPMEVILGAPSGFALIPTEVGFFARAGGGLSTGPTISIGDSSGAGTEIADGVTLPVFTSNSGVRRFSTPAHESIGAVKFTLVTRATGGPCSGVFYCRGFFIEL